MPILLSILAAFFVPLSSFGIIGETLNPESFSGRPCRRGESDPKVCLVCTVFHESRGESEAGKVAVARVVLSRLEKGFARSLCGVIFAPGQFSWTYGRPITLPHADALREVVEATNTALRLGGNGATHFHNRGARVDWGRRGCYVHSEIGSHRFYTCRSDIDSILRNQAQLAAWDAPNEVRDYATSGSHELVNEGIFHHHLEL